MRKALVVVAAIVVLSFSLAAVCLAQAPADVPVPQALMAVKAEPVNLTTSTQMYTLPAGVSWKDLTAQLTDEMTNGGWAAEKSAPECPTGINAVAFSKGMQMCVVFYLPADGPSGVASLLSVVLAAPTEGAESPAGEEPAAAPSGELPGCCQAPAAGKGLIWFENHIGQEVIIDVLDTQVKVPAKQSDVAGCACLEGDPGQYQAIAKLPAGSENLTMDVEIVEGEVVHVPLALK